MLTASIVSYHHRVSEIKQVIVVLRLAFYFTPVLIVLLPLIVQDLFRYRSQCIMIFFITVVYTCLFCYTISTGGEKNKLIPYKTILSKQK